MRILGFDTALSACSAALWEDGRILARSHETMPRGQSERLMPMVLEVMDEAGIRFPDVDLLAVTTGPGAFTGLRIGLAAARGMALAGGLPCLGVTTLDAVAAGVPEPERQAGQLLVTLESRRADLYAQAFDHDLKPRGDPRAVLPGDLPAMVDGDGPVIVAGDAAGPAAESLYAAGVEVALSAAPGVPDGAVVAAVAAGRWSPDAIPAPPAPLYLRPPDATVPRKGGRLRP
ncbi:MAG: tRNA (adenosine(37)-N6)-threonylcarbamoyltransferase complex dimerization subunit type 1 TsaB [Rhodospirillales bacterium]